MAVIGMVLSAVFFLARINDAPGDSIAATKLETPTFRANTLHNDDDRANLPDEI
jgi:hypothetical protein